MSVRESGNFEMVSSSQPLKLNSKVMSITTRAVYKVLIRFTSKLFLLNKLVEGETNQEIDNSQLLLIDEDKKVIVEKWL